MSVSAPLPDPGLPLGVLGSDSIRRLLEGPEPLIEGLRDADAQIQPNGVDLTLEHIWQFTSGGIIGGSAPGRRLPTRTPVAGPADGWYRLAPGGYLVTLHEVLHMPGHLMALAPPRSTLLRCGAHLYGAVIDAGYVGRLEALLTVFNPDGLTLAVDAAMCQIAFFPLSESVAGYRGFYQGT